MPLRHGKEWSYMIYTLTFNPALDYIVRVPDYVEGQVNRTSGEKLLAGGKGINVSTVLTNLGIENIALGFVSGFTGKMIVDILDGQGVNHDFTELDAGFSRINVKIKCGRETEINGSGPVIDKKAMEKLYNKLDKLSAGDMLILAGSVPKGMNDSVYCDIAEHLSDKKVSVVADATGTLLTNVLKYKPFLIKPNNYELEEIFKKPLDDDFQIEQAARKLQKTGARNVLVSKGAGGALLICENQRCYSYSAPVGNAVNTTGSGDSMIAGFIAGYLEKRDYEYALKMGLCAGSASAFSDNLATGAQIRDLLAKTEF